MFQTIGRSLHVAVLALGSSLLALTAFAQNGEPAEIQQKAQEVRQELIEIQRNTLEENPELRDQGEALETLITDMMKEQGATPEEDMERLQELQTKAQDPELEQAERQEMAQEFQEIQRDLIRARQQATQSEEVQSEQAEFQTAMLEAMQEQNPRTEELLAEMREIQVEQQRQLQQQIEQQSGGSPQ